MTTSTVATRAAVTVAVALSLSLSAWAQPAASYKSGSEFYLAYRQAFAAAKSIDAILPWMAKSRHDQMMKTPPAERTQMFGMIKEMDDNTNIKVIKETPTANGAELQVEAVSGKGKTKQTATVKLLKEGGAWKLDGESWKGSM